MAAGKEIRGKIKSVENTKKITSLVRSGTTALRIRTIGPVAPLRTVRAAQASSPLCTS